MGGSLGVSGSDPLVFSQLGQHPFAVCGCETSTNPQINGQIPPASEMRSQDAALRNITPVYRNTDGIVYS